MLGFGQSWLCLHLLHARAPSLIGRCGRRAPMMIISATLRCLAKSNQQPSLIDRKQDHASHVTRFLRNCGERASEASGSNPNPWTLFSSLVSQIMKENASLLLATTWTSTGYQPATTFIASPLSARLHIPCIGGLDDFVTLDWISL